MPQGFHSVGRAPRPASGPPAGLRRRQQGERGFALLVVFLIAAGIMISLYLEIPRVAFESQRNREEILIERGEQYSRAIEVFYRKNKRYPGKMEDLENFNNLRFLRKRYKDPLTGKDEWRIVHMGPTGQLADSLVEKPGQQPGQQLAGIGGAQANGANGQGASGQGVSGQTSGQPAVPGAPPNPDDVNVAMNRVRPSDRGGRAGFGPGTPGYDPNNPNAQQQQPVDSNGNPIFDPNQNGNNSPGFNPNVNPSFNPNNPNGQVSQTGFNPNFPQQQVNFPGQQPAFGNQPGINPGGVQPGGQPVFYQNGQPFSPGAQLQGQLGAQNGQNPMQAGFGQNPALNAINNQLRNQAGFQPGGYNNSGYGSQTQIPPGATQLADGSIKMPDGSVMKPDGTITYPQPGQQPAAGQFPVPTQGNASGFGGGGFNNGQPPNGQNTSGFNTGAGTSGFGTPAQTSQQTGQSFGGAGIAGVASNQAGVGIKRYNERSKYKEWEFVYDYRKPKTKATTGVTGLKPSDMNKSDLNLSGPGTPPRNN